MRTPRKKSSAEEDALAAGSPPLHLLLLGVAPTIAHIISGRVEAPPLFPEAQPYDGTDR